MQRFFRLYEVWGSPKGRRGGGVCLDPQDSPPLDPPQNFKYFVCFQVAYGPQVESYFSGSRDKRVCMWQAGQEEPVLTFSGHELVVTGLTLNNGQYTNLQSIMQNELQCLQKRKDHTKTSVND